MTDHELLSRYVQSRDQDAFREIAARYAGVVYAAALRQLKNKTDAEDAAQAVFVVLAQRAATIRDRRTLAAWLLKVTGYVVLNARRARTRREKYEKGTPMHTAVSTNPHDTAQHEEMLGTLDRALSKLPEGDRTALALRYFRDQSHTQIANELNLTEEAAKKRVTRALEKLRTLFARRGVIVPAAVLTTILTKQALAAPPTLALSCAAAGAGTIATTTTAFTLANGAIKMMTLTKTLLTTAAALVILATAGTVGLAAALHTGGGAPTPITPIAAAITATPTTLPTTSATPIKFQKTMPPPTGIVEDPTGKPLPNVVVKLWRDAARWGLDNDILESVKTDANGRYTFTHPLGFESLAGLEESDHYLITAADRQYALGWRMIFSTGERPTYPIRLSTPVTQNFSIVDENNNPIPNAVIGLYLANVPPESRQADPAANARFIVNGKPLSGIANSDAQGNATLTMVPNSRVGFVVTHEGYATQEVLPGDAGTLPPLITMHKETVLTGHVLDDHGNPLPNAIVKMTLPNVDENVQARTDPAGKFITSITPSNGWPFPNFHSQNNWTLHIEHPDFTAAPIIVHTQDGQFTDAGDIKTTPGTLIKGRILDASGAGIPGATLNVQSNGDYKNAINIVSDAAGNFTTRVLPGKLALHLEGTMGGTYLPEGGSVGTHLLVTADQKEIPATLRIPKPIGTLGTIHGKIISPDPAAAAGITLQAGQEADLLTSGTILNTGIYPAPSDADGSFDLDNVPLGQQIVIYAQTKNHKYAGLLQFTPDANTTAVELPFQLTQSINVIVTDEHGNPLADQKINISARVYGRDVGSLKPLTTDENGHGKISGIIPNMEYDLQGNVGDNHEWSVPLRFNNTSDTPLNIIYSPLLPIRVLDEKGNPVNIPKIAQLQIDNRPMRFNPPIEGRLDDGSILIDRDNLTLTRPDQKCTLEFTDDHGNPAVATCIFPPNSSRLDMKMKILPPPATTPQ